MPFVVESDGTIKTYQGDTGSLLINGIPTDQNCQVYLAIQDAKRNFIGKELMVNSFNQSSVEIYIDSDLTDLLTVPANKSFETYYYGVKLCSGERGEEDTMFIGDGDFATQNKILVYPKKVEGER